MDSTLATTIEPTPEEREQFEKEYAAQRVGLLAAYLGLIVFGPVGGHKMHLADEKGARQYQMLAKLIFVTCIAGVLMGLAATPFSFRDILPLTVIGIVCVAITVISSIIATVMLLADYVLLPWEVKERNQTIQLEILTKLRSPVASTPSAPHTPALEAHKQYHAAVASQTVSLPQAYIRLFFLGNFGTHRKYLGDAEGAKAYTLLMGMPTGLVLNVCTFYLVGAALSAITSSSIPPPLSWALMVLLALQTFLAATCWFIIVVMGLKDCWCLRSEVKTHNIELQRKLLEASES
jgi:hypothetical protein